MVWSRQLKVLILQNIASQRSHCYCWGKNTLFCNSTSCSPPLLLVTVRSYANQVTLVKVDLEWEAIMETAELGFVCQGVGGTDTCS